MASFQTHVTFGIALGVSGAIVASATNAITGGIATTLLIAGCAIIGSLAPDIDSDSGVPVNVAFGVASLVGGLVALWITWNIYTPDAWQRYAIPLGVAAGIWIIIGGIFKHFTAHRGMAHSIPAALIAGILTLKLAHHLGIPAGDDVWIGIAMSAGYLLHLVLDELNSAINIHGTPFVPNAALGSALKLFSKDKAAAVLTYGLLFVLIWAARDILIFPLTK